MKTNVYKKRIQNVRRRRYKHSYQSEGSYLETFITQCIISGIILSAVLIIRIIDVPATTAIREHFYQTITAAADIPEDARNLGDMIRRATGIVADEYEPRVQEATPATMPGTVDTSAPIQVNAPGQNFRIDEDVLRELRGESAETP